MKIIYKESFKVRFNRQLLYIGKDNKSAAIAFRNDMRVKIEHLKESPFVYRQSIYFDDSCIRDLIFKGYSITYRVKDETIEVFGLTKYQNSIFDKELK
ncbi:MAG: type II toxin-antitoxin system RelE/ParE family toxin [Sulfuricurvum sp.]